MRPWQFSKPKNPGFGISRDFYYTLLACRAQLPTLLSIVSPDGAGGSVPGLGVPMAKGATKDDLRNPITRGVYALSTKDRHTVVRMMLMGRDEIPFDPEAIVRNPIVASNNPETISRIRATWMVIQLTFESHDAMVYPALEFLQSVAERIAILTDGVIGDPICERYYLPNEFRIAKKPGTKIDVREYVCVVNVPRQDGLWIRTLGMRKFSMAELEVYGVDPALRPQTEALLIGLCQKTLTGEILKVGDRFGNAKMPMMAAQGGLDRGTWDGILCYEIIPDGKVGINDAVRAWADSAC